MIFFYSLSSNKEIPCCQGQLPHPLYPKLVILRCTAKRPRYLWEISEIPWNSQVQILWFVVGEDPRKDRVLAQVIVCPPWTQKAHRDLWVTKGWTETGRLKAGESTLESSVTLGDQYAAFQQAPNLRALNQTHFLSHMKSARETNANNKLSLLWKNVFWALHNFSSWVY